MVVLILIVVVAAIVLVGFGLRLRKLRRDDLRGRSAKIDRRLLTPPPSPYATSKGFRLLDGAAGESAPSAPPRPRLEPDHEYVFSDAQLPPYDMGNLARLRHDEHWALSRSARRSRFSSVAMRLLVIVGVIVLALALTTFYVMHHGPTKGSGPTTTTTIASTTTSRPTSMQSSPMNSGFTT
jgi:hypothetical protein